MSARLHESVASRRRMSNLTVRRAGIAEAYLGPKPRALPRAPPLFAQCHVADTLIDKRRFGFFGLSSTPRWRLAWSGRRSALGRHGSWAALCSAHLSNTGGIG